MKWTSANSSDRKSVFYTSQDSNDIMSTAKQHRHQKAEGNSVTDSSGSIFTFKMGGDDETTESQNSKSSSNASSIERQHHTTNNNRNGTDLKRYLKNFMLFSNLEIESEKKYRDEQLSKIVKALMLFEKKLRKEQEIIQQQLCEKDRVINRQMHTISNMKVKLGVEQLGDDVMMAGYGETTEFCPMCRKKYYLRATKSLATQTSSRGFSNNISDDYSSIQSIEYMSSSEEQEALQSPNPFSTARRSKKYTSKKSYKEYLQSRPPSAMSDGNRSKSNSIQSPNSDKNNNTIGKEIVGGGAAKFSLIMNDIHGIRQQHRQQSCDDTHSLKINRMHGISLTTLNVPANEVKEKEALTSNEDNSVDQSAIKVTVGDESATRKYCDEGLEVKQKIVTRDDWYMSDIEENDTTLNVTKSPYSNVTGVSNSVLECVNQILLQQSMDEYMETQSEVKVTKDPTPTSTRSNKRVHFSTKNSMVQIQPRHHSSSSLSDIHNDATMYENQSTYSNEYELIGSSRTYVDMDAKSLDGFKPKLPPKPDNLMKLQQIAKQRQFVHEQIYKKSPSEYECNESEPDYASISEVQDNIKSVKVVTAEIHNDADHNDNEYSEIKEVPTPTPPSGGDDSFADVPKLPNVYSIIPGNMETPPTSPSKKETSPSNKCIGHDNYITKSPMKKKQLPLAFNTSLKKESASILAEINNANKKTKCVSVAPAVPIKHQQTIKIIDEKIQQEFDWYNLDAEYTKTDIVITPQIENIEEMYQFDDESAVNGDDNVVKVEYNLEDFDYEAPSDSSGIEIETNSSNFTTVIKINESSSSASSSTSEQPSPVNKTTNLMELSETPKIDFKKNKIRYEKFLSESGLLSKPIMARKKFYAGSFV